MDYDASEQDVVLDVFATLLKGPTRDGGRKRADNVKPPWWRDESHEAALFSHLNHWKHKELADRDSGVHPLIHLAWRALALAYQETYGREDPERVESAFMRVQLAMEQRDDMQYGGGPCGDDEGEPS